jgi:hypothetical protein
MDTGRRVGAHREPVLCGAGGTVAYMSFYWTTALFLGLRSSIEGFFTSNLLIEQETQQGGTCEVNCPGAQWRLLFLRERSL